MDCIGPWNIEMYGTTLTFHALTMTESQSTLTEIVRLSNKTSQHVAHKFETTYLARYPRPLRVIHDNGGEFIGNPFRHMLYVHGIKDVNTTAYNPQANSIAERMHQTIGNMLRTLLHSNPPQHLHQVEEILDSCLASAMQASRNAIHHTLNTSPGAITFQRDMLYPIQYFADFNQLEQRRQTLIDQNAQRKNRGRISHDYEIGDEILILAHDTNSLDPRAEGPYFITQVHANGTVTIQLSHNLTERINIRRIRPYHRSYQGEGE
jgi:hypothetical protein